MAIREPSGLALSPEADEELPVVAEEERRPMSLNKKRLLSKQMSMKETTREAKWEKRRKQILHRRKAMTMTMASADVGRTPEEEAAGRLGRVKSLTDGDLDELRGSIELGFGFDEESGGHDLVETLPALDLYFAVNRHFSSSSSSSPNLSGTPGSPRSPSGHRQEGECWIVNPGEDPQQVKMRLRHWAQVVACSVKQCRN